MSTPVRITAFLAGLVLVFGAAFGAGRLVDGGPARTSEHQGSRHADH